MTIFRCFNEELTHCLAITVYIITTWLDYDDPPLLPDEPRFQAQNRCSSVASVLCEEEGGGNTVYRQVIGIRLSIFAVAQWTKPGSGWPYFDRTVLWLCHNLVTPPPPPTLPPTIVVDTIRGKSLTISAWYGDMVEPVLADEVSWEFTCIRVEAAQRQTIDTDLVTSTTIHRRH